MVGQTMPGTTSVTFVTYPLVCDAMLAELEHDKRHQS